MSSNAGPSGDHGDINLVHTRLLLLGKNSLYHNICFAANSPATPFALICKNGRSAAQLLYNDAEKLVPSSPVSLRNIGHHEALSWS